MHYTQLVNNTFKYLLRADFLVSLFCLFLLFSCNQEAKLVAKVGDKTLNEDELFVLLKMYDIDDNDTSNVNLFVEDWCNRHLFAQELKSTHPEQYKLTALRSDLFLADLAKNEVEQQYIRDNIDSVITEQQIQDYYTEHQEDFLLQDYIVKALYLKIPKTVDFKKENIQQKIKLNKPADLDQVTAFARLNAENFYFDDSSWIYFKELSKDIPLTKYNIDNIVLNRTKTYFSDEEHTYFLNIIDFKLKDEAPPIEFLENQIRTIIITNRSHDLLSNKKGVLLHELKQKHEVHIYH